MVNFAGARPLEGRKGGPLILRGGPKEGNYG